MVKGAGMARAKRESDNVYNARRRYRRQAERYLAKAEKASGIRKARYEAQERDAKNFVERMTDSSGKNYDRGMALQFLRYRYGQDGKTHSYKDIGENKEQIQAALLDWHEKGYPKK